MTVGRGWRTPAKHAMMRSFVGQEVGAGGRMAAITRHIWVDLTAGDAVTDHEWRSNCSPGILANYASQARKPVVIRLNEIQPNTDKDDAQWAYLICDPEKWRSSTERVVKTAFKQVDRTATMTWFRTTPDQFEEMKQVLFLTKKERGGR